MDSREIISLLNEVNSLKAERQELLKRLKLNDNDIRNMEYNLIEYLVNARAYTFLSINYRKLNRAFQGNK